LSFSIIEISVVEAGSGTVLGAASPPNLCFHELMVDVSGSEGVILIGHDDEEALRGILVGLELVVC